VIKQRFCLAAGFIIVGDMNTVAMVMTLILCISYAAINYAYFALATGVCRSRTLGIY
jgi:hypothetical protein